MKSVLKLKIQALTESKNDDVKKAANELLLAFDVYEQQNKDMSKLVKSKLADIDNQETTELMNYVTSRDIVENLGIRKALDIFEKSRKIKADPELKRLVNVYQIELMNGIPEHMLAASFIKNFEKYHQINEAAYDVYHTISKGYDKNKAHQLVANTIFALEQDDNVEFLQDTINSLNMAFNLPGSHVKAFVYQTLRDRADLHPALPALLNELKMVDSKTQSKVNFYQDKNGRVAVSKRLSPTLEHKEQKETSFLIGNNVYVVGDKNMRKANKEDMERIFAHTDGQRFIQMCQIFTNFQVSENKLTANDGMNTYTIEKVLEEGTGVAEGANLDKLSKTHSKDTKPEIVINYEKNEDDFVNDWEEFGNFIIANTENSELSGESGHIYVINKNGEMVEYFNTVSDAVVAIETGHINENRYNFTINGESRGSNLKRIVEGLQMNETNNEIAELIQILLSNFDLVNFLDQVTVFDPEYADETVDMMQGGDNVVFVVVDDVQGMMGDVVSGDAEEVAADIENDLGINIRDEITEDGINEGDDEENIEKEGELLELESQLEIVEANLKKIDELDEAFQTEEDIVELKGELDLEKETIVKRIAELQGELDGAGADPEKPEGKDNANEEGGDTNEIIKGIIDQLTKLLQPEKETIEKTEEEPEVAVEGTPITKGGISITPHATFRRNGDSLEYESFLEVTGLSDKVKQKLVESKTINTVPDSNLVIVLEGEEEMEDEVKRITTDMGINEASNDNLFTINGYYKDSKEEFNDYLVTSNNFEDDGAPEGYNDDDIFFYDITKEDIEKAIKDGENSEYEFVITSYN